MRQDINILTKNGSVAWAASCKIIHSGKEGVLYLLFICGLALKEVRMF
jgi:hypothetical protein